ncbi:MAG: GGDEF domain-containing protein [Lachnospiraceae bacterium]|nr:GGDEF domain-containing protein [Lachnospiraceae bacterium]
MSYWKKFVDFLRGETIGRYRAVIEKRNARALQTMGVINMIVSTTLFALSRFTIMDTFDGVYIFFFVIGIITFLIGRYINRFLKKSNALFYVLVEMYLLSGVFISVILRPNQISITFIVLLCVTLLVIVDRPYRVFAFILLNISGFLLLDMQVKKGYVLAADLYYTTAFGLMAIVLNFFTLREHMDSVESIGQLEDYSEKVELKSRIDQLTGILNRGYGEETMRRHIEARDYGMFCIIDGDRFKHINDTYGHAVGDKALITIAAGLKRSFRKGDIITRMGGDEFAVYAPGVRTDEEGEACIKRLKAYLSETKLPEMNGEDIHISIGQTIYNKENPMTFEELYTKTDAKMYLNKLSIHHEEIEEDPET